MEFGEKMTPKTIDFTSGANPLGPSNKAKNAIRSHVRHIDSCNGQSLGHLKSYIAKREGVDEACIAFGSGSTVILNAILELTGPGKILIPQPTSGRYSTLLSRHGRESTLFPLQWDGNFDLHGEGFCKAMKGCGGAVLPNPHDMAGSVTSSEEILKVVDKAARLGIYVILDESYGDYTGIPTMAPLITASCKAVIVRTFSTFHALGGLRLGYVIGSPDLLHMMEAGLDLSTINSLAPRAAMASLKDSGYRGRTLLFIEHEKAYLSKKLTEIQGLKCHVSPTNLIVIQFQKDQLHVEKAFKKYHMRVRMFSDEHGNACTAFPVQGHRKNAYFVRILKRIVEA